MREGKTEKTISFLVRIRVDTVYTPKYKNTEKETMTDR